MRKAVVFMHTSLDGFVAGRNGQMDWIHVDEEIFNYAGSPASPVRYGIVRNGTRNMRLRFMVSWS